MRRHWRTTGLVLALALAPACSPAQDEEPSDESSGDAASAPRTPGPTNVEEQGIATNDDHTTTSVDDGSGSEGAATDTPLAVDVGNPKDTGPVPIRPRGKVAIADAVPIDGGQALEMTVVGLKLGDELIEIPARAFNLMDYRDGARLEVFDGETNGGTVSTLAFVMAPETPVIFRDGSGVSHEVFVPAGPDGHFELTGTFATPLTLVDGVDATMHVDLRYGLRPVDATVVAQYGNAVAGYDFWLVPVHDVFPTPAVGHLSLLGLVDSLVQVACAYSATSILDLSIPLLGIGLPLADDGDDRCYDADASDVKDGGKFFLGFLTPGTYRIRLYVSDGTYVELPTLASVTANLSTTLDLSGILAILP